MKILHVFSNYKWTGPAEPAVNLAAELRNRGHEMLFACADAPPSPEYPRVGDHAAELGLPLAHGLFLDKHLNPLHVTRDVRRLRQLIRQFQPQIIHTHMRNDHLLAALAAPRSARMVRTFYDGGLASYGIRERWLLGRRSHFVVFCAPSARDAAVSRRILPPDRTAVVEGAVDLARFDPGRPLPAMRPRLSLAPGDYVVGIVARVQWHRRFGVLLDAARKVMLALPDFRLVVIGRGTDFDKILTEPVRQAGIGHAVRFTDYLCGDDYVGCLHALDVKTFLVPGSDGSCRAVREAMAMGLPVVAARRGMLPEIVHDGLTGRVIDDTPDNLAAAFVELHDASLRTRLGAAARERARRDFDLKHQAEQVERIYERVLSMGDD